MEKILKKINHGTRTTYTCKDLQFQGDGVLKVHMNIRRGTRNFSIFKTKIEMTENMKIMKGADHSRKACNLNQDR